MNDTDLAAIVAKYGPTRTLDQLLHRAEITTWTRHVWFKDAVLKPPYLYIEGDAGTVAHVTKTWGPSFQQQMPGLEVRPKLKVERPTPTVTKYPSIKPGRLRDLLDDEDV